MYEKGEWKIDGDDSDAWELSEEEAFDFEGMYSEDSENN